MYSGRGKLVGRIQVVDYDEGVNSQFTMVIYQQSPLPLSFNISGLDLYSTIELDRENISSYVLIIQATDKGNPTQVGTGTVTVSVADINDHKPFFNRSLYEFTLSEKQTSGMFTEISLTCLQCHKHFDWLACIVLASQKSLLHMFMWEVWHLEVNTSTTCQLLLNCLYFYAHITFVKGTFYNSLFHCRSVVLSTYPLFFQAHHAVLESSDVRKDIRT